MEWGYVVSIVLCVIGASYGMTRIVQGVLVRRAVLDHPNERSSHTVPTPRGGGLAVIAVLVSAVLIVHFGGAFRIERAVILSVLCLSLAAASWIDDLRGLPISFRLLIHLIVAAAALSLGIEGPFLGGILPGWLDGCLAAVAWIWFINLFNFMDGIDGIAAVETISVGLGVAAVATIGGILAGPAMIGLIVAAATVGFLFLNWHPARIFLGDVGSVPLGFILGWLLLALAANGHLTAALILPLYFVVDATWTLISRALRRENIWQAHRQHFYQRAVQAGRRHDDVVKAVALANTLLILCALATHRFSWYPLVGAILVVAGLLRFLAQKPVIERAGEAG